MFPRKNRCQIFPFSKHHDLCNQWPWRRIGLEIAPWYTLMLLRMSNLMNQRHDAWQKEVHFLCWVHFYRYEKCVNRVKEKHKLRWAYAFISSLMEEKGYIRCIWYRYVETCLEIVLPVGRAKMRCFWLSSSWGRRCIHWQSGAAYQNLMTLSIGIHECYLSSGLPFSSSFKLPSGGNADFLNMSFWSDDIPCKYL